MGWLEKIKEVLRRRVDVLRDVPSLLREHPRLVIIGLGGVALTCAAVLLVSVVSVNREAKAAPGEGISGALSPRTIPVEELFPPGEPDFLPPIILSRERRQSWTAEDALPYWTDPLEGGSVPYVDRVHGLVDSLMERVP